MYRNILIERHRTFEMGTEPRVLDYLDERNNHCLQEWHKRLAVHHLRTQKQMSLKIRDERN